MDAPAAGDELQVVQGEVARVTFRSESTGWSVLRLRPAGPEDKPSGTSRKPSPDLDGGLEVTVVGRFASVAPGESLRCTGRWTVHPEYGRQFVVESYQPVTPNTLRGIERFLGSGMIKGVGPATAARLVEKFGTRTLEVIAEHPKRLTEVEGIGERRAEQIAAAYRLHRGAQEAMVFLQGYGIGIGHARRIYQRYGDRSVAVVRRDPYVLAEEVHGIGFRTADRIARDLGLPPDSPQRAAAAVLHLLDEAAGEGHVYLPVREVLQRGTRLLEVPEERILEGIERLRRRGLVVLEAGAEPGEASTEKPAGRLYRTPLHRAETAVARRLAQLVQGARQVTLSDLKEQLVQEIGEVERLLGVELAPAQREAVQKAIESGVLVITGGPGTGKTTIIRNVVALMRRRQWRVLMAAPTGRAAQRMKEAVFSGPEARAAGLRECRDLPEPRTIHRLLEFGPASQAGRAGPGVGPSDTDGDATPSVGAVGVVDEQDAGSLGLRFNRNAENPLEADAVIIDEVSMLDLPLARHLLEAIRPGTRLILVGDADQLPSVGPGNFLRDLLESGSVGAVRLTEVFRQAGESGIVQNAHRINAGQMPDLKGSRRDFFFIKAENGEAMAREVVGLVTRRLPGFLKLDPVTGVQVLSPIRRGPAGVEAMNQVLQQALNPPAAGKPELAYGSTRFRLGDKVMQVRNNYQLQGRRPGLGVEQGVFNGEIGWVRSIDLEEGTLAVRFEDGKIVEYDRDQLSDLSLAYALTVHKSQGNEFPAVVVALAPTMPAMMSRNLLYTAVTRARRLVVLVGTFKGLAMFVRNATGHRRYSVLAARLRRELQGRELQGPGGAAAGAAGAGSAGDAGEGNAGGGAESSAGS